MTTACSSSTGHGGPSAVPQDWVPVPPDRIPVPKWALGAPWHQQQMNAGTHARVSSPDTPRQQSPGVTLNPGPGGHPTVSDPSAQLLARSPGSAGCAYTEPNARCACCPPGFPSSSAPETTPQAQDDLRHAATASHASETGCSGNPASVSASHVGNPLPQAHASQSSSAATALPARPTNPGINTSAEEEGRANDGGNRVAASSSAREVVHDRLKAFGEGVPFLTQGVVKDATRRVQDLLQALNLLQLRMHAWDFRMQHIQRCMKAIQLKVSEHMGAMNHSKPWEGASGNNAQGFEVRVKNLEDGMEQMLRQIHKQHWERILELQKATYALQQLLMGMHRRSSS